MSQGPVRVAVEAEGRLIAWIPGRLRNPLNSSHGHWAVKARERKGWRERTTLCLKDAANRAGIALDARSDCDHNGRRCWHACEAKVVVLTAFVWNLYDEDGLAAALKPVVDGLVDAGLLDRDDTKSRHRVERRQAINRQHRGVEVVVEPRAWKEGA